MILKNLFNLYSECRKCRRIPVLLFHNIGIDESSTFLHPKYFEEIIKYFFEKGYRTVDLDSYYGFLKGEISLASKALIITFDDGYRNNLEIAKPIMDKYGFKGTIFVATKFIGQQVAISGRSKDPASFLNATELRLLEKGGWDIANHLHSHRVLVDLTSDEISDEFYNSKKILNNILEKKQNLYFVAPPRNKLNKYVINILNDEGAKIIFSGGILEYSNAVVVPRIEIFNKDDLKKIWLKMLAIFLFISTLKARVF